MLARAPKVPRILVVAPSSASLGEMLAQIRDAGLDVAVALTADQAVAVCLGSHFAAVALDAALIRNDDWSVAKSLKLLRPALPILLLDSRAVVREGALPPNLDALASRDDPIDVLLKVKQLLLGNARSANISPV